MKRVKKIKPKIILLILLSVLLFGCNEEPKVERSKLVKIYVEKTIAQNKYSSFPDSLALAKKNIFEKYNMTEAEFDSVILSLEAKVDYWDEFFKESKEYLDSLKNEPNRNQLP